jgi:carbon monoxide dehydrogenase subunit G
MVKVKVLLMVTVKDRVESALELEYRCRLRHPIPKVKAKARGNTRLLSVSDNADQAQEADKCQVSQVGHRATSVLVQRK